MIWWDSSGGQGQMANEGWYVLLMFVHLVAGSARPGRCKTGSYRGGVGPWKYACRNPATR
jgi:hypothetical protein